MSDKPSAQFRITPKMVILGIFILLVLIWIYESMQPAVVTTLPSPAPPPTTTTSTPPVTTTPAPPSTTPVPVIPATTLPPNPQICQRGWYCDGTPVPDSESTEGKIVCGANNIRYQCVNNGGTLGWKALDACPSGMANRCTSVPTNCLGGWYCDGTWVEKANSVVGSIVCGSGNKQYQCTSNGTGVTPSWRIIGDCTAGMAHKCP